MQSIFLPENKVYNLFDLFYYLTLCKKSNIILLFYLFILSL